MTVSVGAASAEEGEALAFPVELTGALSSNAVLGWRTAAGTAASGTDYAVVASGSLTIAAGQQSGTLTVSTTEDQFVEAAETLTATITGTTLPSGVSLGVATATGTIVDDDALIASVYVEESRVTEGSPADFKLSVTGGISTASVVVSYTTTGTAASGQDYTAPFGSATMAPGASSGLITVWTKSDDVAEPMRLLS